MHMGDLDLRFERLHGLPPRWYAPVTAGDWQRVAMHVQRTGGRLVALWARSDAAVRSISASYVVPEGLAWLELTLAPDQTTYPDLASFFPTALRMQRAAADMTDIRPEPAADARPWLQHGAWPADYFPLQARAARVVPTSAVTEYPFVSVTGDGVHEIAVGPVHAGIIEPGHFRFSVVGEKVLRLEQRLGYTHKGIEQRFTQIPPLQAYKLAGRLSGDSTVAHAWAYCMALESAAGCTVPPRAANLRALLLERERVANHLGDLGALGNDAALAFGLAQFSRLREDWQRLSRELFGHRLLMDCVVPGGVASDLEIDAVSRIARQCEVVTQEVQILRAIYDEHAGLQDRFLTTGRVTPELAARLGLSGLAGRASGLAKDLRCDQPWPPYDRLQVKMATQRNGDVAARVAVRFDELLESLRLVRTLSAELPSGEIGVSVILPEHATRGAGWVEGWRGEVFVALELDTACGGNAIQRCHCHDPSWQNWPVLEHAVMGNIVPDFPLINKSFNLSYSGHDL